MVGDSKHRPPLGNEKGPGAVAAFPYDRMTVERFREAFPRARWSDERKAWFVPGKTATRRLDRWLAREAEQVPVHGDLKGRDAYAFDPIESPYLDVEDDLRISTPYSKTILTQLRAIPWSRWDDELRVWRVPFRSYEELRRRWAMIEAAARRNEPAERRLRREAECNSPARRASRLRSAERRRRRYPLAAGELPPIGRPVMTEQYGIVIFVEVSGELVEPHTLAVFYLLPACGAGRVRLRLGIVARSNALGAYRDVARPSGAGPDGAFQGLVAADLE
jgi:hypothetical protein